jgi:hypothetical protein
MRTTQLPLRRAWRQVYQSGKRPCDPVRLVLPALEDCLDQVWPEFASREARYVGDMEIAGMPGPGQEQRLARFAVAAVPLHAATFAAKSRRVSLAMHYIALALPGLRPAPPRGNKWLHEIKFDDWRVQLHKHDGADRALHQEQPTPIDCAGWPRPLRICRAFTHELATASLWRAMNRACLTFTRCIFAGASAISASGLSISCITIARGASV